jgi:hypothetical protein
MRITPDLTIDVALGSITGAGFLTGDRVIAGGDRGRVVGVVGDRICVKTAKGANLFKRSTLVFESRDRCIPPAFQTRSDDQLVAEASPRFCRAFGFRQDDVVAHRLLGNGAVAGFANGIIWFVFDCLNRRICTCKETSLAAIHSIVTIVSTPLTIKRVVSSENVEYPIQPLEPFNVRSKASFGEAIGELGAFYCVEHYFDKKCRLVEKKFCQRTDDYREFRQFDCVLEDGQAGTIVDCSARNVFVLGNSSLLNNERHVGVERGLSLIFGVVGRGRRRIAGEEFDVGACSFGGGDAMPGDLWAVADGDVRIVGLKEGRVMCSRSLDLRADAPVEKFDGVRKGAVLVNRRVSPSTRVCRFRTGGPIEVSVYVASFVGLRFLPGDEIAVEGERDDVCGKMGGYLWVQKVGGEGVSFFSPAGYSGAHAKAELVGRPGADWRVFLD